MLDLEQTYLRWLTYCKEHGITHTMDAAVLTLAEVLLEINKAPEIPVVVNPVVKINGQEIPVETPEPLQTLKINPNEVIWRSQAEPKPEPAKDKWDTLLEAYKKLKDNDGA